MTKEEKQQYNRAYYKKNREACKAQARADYHQNKAERKLTQKKYRMSNKPLLASKNNAWRAANKEWIEDYNSEYMPEWYLKNKERCRAKGYDWHHRNKEHYNLVRTERRFGLELGGYTALLTTQNNKCAICAVDYDLYRKATRKRFAVDHCHITGNNRGLLCSNCNTALGLIQDSTTSLSNAIGYLQAQAKIIELEKKVEAKL